MKKITIIIMMLVLAVSYSNGQITINLNPNQDATISTLYPDDNFETSEKFESYLYNGKYAERRRSFISFDLSSIPTGSTIVSAKLFLFGISHVGQNDSYLIRVVDSWDESTVTWNNQPETQKGDWIVLPQSTSSDQDYLLDATSFVQNWTDGAYPNNGFMLRIANVTLLQTNALVFGSSDNPDASKHPEIEITYIPPAGQLNVTHTKTDIDCEGAGTGSIDISVSGGTTPYSYQWSNGETTEDIINLYAGIYIVTVTDAVGTSISDIIQISEPEPIIVPGEPEPCTEIFISEYNEGGKHDQALEIYNPTDEPIWLNRYFVRVYMNGAPTPLITQLIGTIMPGETFVVANPNADDDILALSDQTSNKLNFNGDDAIQIVKVLNEVPDYDFNGVGGNPHEILAELELQLIDQIGIPGVDPGNQGFPVGSGTTKNSNLRRSPNVTKGVQDWDCGQMQWSMNGSDDFSDLKQHENVCSECYTFFEEERSWYVKGIKETWYDQEDIYVFRLENKQAYTEIFDTIIVDSIVYDSTIGLKYNIVYFDALSTDSEREMIREYIRNSVQFEVEFPAITKSPNDYMTEKKWFISNDIISVVFWDNDPSPSLIQTFMDNHDLFIVHEPDPILPKVGNSSWTYAFGINPSGCKTLNSINIARQIYEVDNSIVKIAEPWIEPIKLATNTNDEYYDDSWHIKNTAQCLGMSVSGNGTDDADCDIEEAWGEGYSGEGITVAVIDKGVFESNHPDISSKYLSGYDYIDNDSDVSTCSGTAGAHGQACAGLIAAISDNSIGSAGVAFDAQIVPYITWFGNAYKAFQGAFAAGVDIISCSWGYAGYDESTENDINKCRTLGRDGKGIIIVCSAGNDDCNNDDLSNCIPVQTDKAFPAYLPDVIGIIASNPEDSRKSRDDVWTSAWGSNYGSDFDVASPGTHYITTDLLGGNGYNPAYAGFTYDNCAGGNLDSDYTYFNGTSGAAPIAAGVCALVLQANPDLTAGQVQQVLENTADKVGGYDYNAISTGRSLEMGYGRINAHAAVIQAVSGIAETDDNINYFNVYPSPTTDNATIKYSLSSASDVIIEIYDYTGRTITTVFEADNLSPNQLYSINIETNNFSNGVYFVILKTQSSVQTMKLSVVK